MATIRRYAINRDTWAVEHTPSRREGGLPSLATFHGPSARRQAIDFADREYGPELDAPDDRQPQLALGD